MKKLCYFFMVAAIILSHLMCFVVAWNYRDMLCGIDHMGYSAPAEAAFLTAIPYAVGIILCIVLAFIFRRKAK